MFDVVPIPPSTVVSAGREKIALGLSSYKTMNPLTAVALMGLFARRKMTLLLSHGDAFVAHSRNTVAEKFLETDCTHLFLCDDDMLLPIGERAWFATHSGINLPEPFASFNVLDRLLSHNKSLVGGLYFGRTKHGPPMYGEGMKNQAEAEYARRGPYNQVKPCRWVGTGCMMISRQVFLDFEKRWPRLSRARNGGRFHGFTATEHGLLDGLEKLRNMLSEGHQTGEKSLQAFQDVEKIFAESHASAALGTGEDVSFCVRAAAAGHQPFVDMGLILGHVGSCVYTHQNTYAKPK